MRGLLVALGESVLVDGFALAGATVRAAEDPGAVRRVWASLPEEVSVVVLTARAAAALADGGVHRESVLTVVMPS